MTRMKLKDFLRPAPGMSPAELREYRTQHPAGTWTLLDVRQPGEYEKRHLPGAVLIPMPELRGRLEELERDKPLVAY